MAGRRSTDSVPPTTIAPATSWSVIRPVASVVDNGAELAFSADEATAVAVSRALVESGVGIAALIPEAASLEALFFELTEDRPEEAAAA